MFVRSLPNFFMCCCSVISHLACSHSLCSSPQTLVIGILQKSAVIVRLHLLGAFNLKVFNITLLYFYRSYMELLNFGFFKATYSAGQQHDPFEAPLSGEQWNRGTQPFYRNYASFKINSRRTYCSTRHNTLSCSSLTLSNSLTLISSWIKIKHKLISKRIWWRDAWSSSKLFEVNEIKFVTAPTVGALNQPHLNVPLSKGYS